MYVSLQDDFHANIVHFLNTTLSSPRRNASLKHAVLSHQRHASRTIPAHTPRAHLELYWTAILQNSRPPMELLDAIRFLRAHLLSLGGHDQIFLYTLTTGYTYEAIQVWNEIDDVAVARRALAMLSEESLVSLYVAALGQECEIRALLSGIEAVGLVSLAAIYQLGQAVVRIRRRPPARTPKEWEGLYRRVYTFMGDALVVHAIALFAGDDVCSDEVAYTVLKQLTLLTSADWRTRMSSHDLRDLVRYLVDERQLMGPTHPVAHAMLTAASVSDDLS